MNVSPSFPIPQPSNYQNDPDKMNTAICYLEVKVLEAKKTHRRAAIHARYAGEDYLRTKLNPDMESEELLLEQDRNQKGQDVINKQITHLNKYVDLLLQSLHSTDRAHNENLNEKATYNKDETVRLVRATMVGEGLKVNMGRSAPATSSTHSTPQLQRSSGSQQSLTPDTHADIPGPFGTGGDFIRMGVRKKSNEQLLVHIAHLEAVNDVLKGLYDEWLDDLCIHMVVVCCNGSRMLIH
ncbi:hypothetical protein DICVIV_05529 [Dictyocaulus viviparus]|uniref:Mediator of RNA polymerase II transcription subunit 8 n=1 Tax=Dictyocaulus viviparus TaxID=29172 RepID=A0A0D8XUR8_DICVI|nr:hypothetical protein DICVIV_05529 [Dictyocaulus viviparus]